MFLLVLCNGCTAQQQFPVMCQACPGIPRHQPGAAWHKPTDPWSQSAACVSTAPLLGVPGLCPPCEQLQCWISLQSLCHSRAAGLHRHCCQWERIYAPHPSVIPHTANTLPLYFILFFLLPSSRRSPWPGMPTHHDLALPQPSSFWEQEVKPLLRDEGVLPPPAH